MLAVVITLTSVRRNEFIGYEKAKVRIAILPILEVKTGWNATLELLKHAFRLREFTREWPKSPKYINIRPLFAAQDEWTAVKSATEILQQFRF